MKKYVFQVIYEVIEEVVVEADDYEEAEVKIEEGEGEILSEDKYERDFKCIKMPDKNEEVV